MVFYNPSNSWGMPRMIRIPCIHSRHVIWCIFFVIILFFHLPHLFSQQNILEQSISLPNQTCRLDSALSLIESKISYYFSYNSEIIQVEKEVNTECHSVPLYQVLDRFIEDSQIQYRVIGNSIVLYKDSEETAGEPIPPSDSTSVVHTIYGTILDINTGAPVPFSTIALGGSRIGTISNIDGKFIFKLQTGNLSDTINIACLGYKTARYSIQDLIGFQRVIHLQPDYIPIQEVIIRMADPLGLLHSAIQKVDENYITDPILQTSFYRETVKKSNRYLIVSEAILGIFRTGMYEPLNYDQVKLIKGRKNINLRQSDSITLTLKAGLETSLLLDVIRNTPEFLQEENFSKFRYTMTDILLDGNYYIYDIEFEQRTNTIPPHFKGHIYIDMNSLAIRAVVFEMDPETIHAATNDLVLRKPRYLNVKPLYARYYVRYHQDGGKFHLSHLRFENSFRTRRKNQLFSNTYYLMSEMVITKTETGNINKFRPRESVNIQDPFIEMIGGYDEEFWEDYNYLKLDEPLEEALKNINK